MAQSLRGISMRERSRVKSNFGTRSLNDLSARNIVQSAMKNNLNHAAHAAHDASRPADTDVVPSEAEGSAARATLATNECV